jgi:hypothetical protein
VEGATTGNSLCADSIWEINAVAEDEATGGQIEVTTGVGVRISADNAENVANICP